MDSTQDSINKTTTKSPIPFGKIIILPLTPNDKEPNQECDEIFAYLAEISKDDDLTVQHVEQVYRYWNIANDSEREGITKILQSKGLKRNVDNFLIIILEDDIHHDQEQDEENKTSSAPLIKHIVGFILFYRFMGRNIIKDSTTTRYGIHLSLIIIIRYQLLVSSNFSVIILF